ncbi:MAG TPA: peptidylprolyl isomerase [Verrucomicrobiae bacterium]|nr:peptidylprolyl isomerase [Verrucomicrobiae bacterium]
MKTLAVSLAVLCAAAPLASAAPAEGTNSRPALRASDLFTNSIVAKAEGVTISRAQLDDALTGIRTAAASRGQTIPAEQITALERQILQRLIQVQLLNSKATEADKTAGAEAAEKRVADLKKQAGSDELFSARLKTIGLTEPELKAKMSEELTAEAVVKRELKVEVSDEEVKKYFDENPGRFEKPEMVRAAHVLIGTTDPATRAPLSDEQKAAKKRVAEDVLKRARAGEDFAKLAKEFSEDPGSKETGGEYTFPKGQMVPEFEGAAFSMNTNQISDLVTTQFGYHIIKTLEKIPAKKIELAEVSTEVKEFLTGQAIQKQLPEYLEKLEKASKVEILDERLKPVSEGAASATGAHDHTDHTGHNH